MTAPPGDSAVLSARAASDAHSLPRTVPPGTGSDDHVVLLDERRQPIGTAPRATVHTGDTPLHLAFSCYVRDDEGRVLMTRRALAKRTWPGVWTNSCCGHPRLGESMPDAIERRLHDELGVEVTDLACALPDFAYVATDASGIVENEVCPVYTAQLLHPSRDLVPNPAEVSDWVWASWNDLAAAVAAAPFAFSPWAVQQVPQLSSASSPS